jgi:hypothetical protein
MKKAKEVKIFRSGRNGKFEEHTLPKKMKNKIDYSKETMQRIEEETDFDEGDEGD